MFPLDINDYEKSEDRFQMLVNVFGFGNKVYPLYFQKNLIIKRLIYHSWLKKTNLSMHLLNILLMFSKTKHKGKKHYCMSCLQNFTTEEILSNHKKQCLLINGCQAVNYESEIIKFTNYNKQIPILFKTYADTECFSKRTKLKEGEHKIKYEKHIPNSIGAKLVCIDDRFTLPSIILKVKIVLINLSHGY